MTHWNHLLHAINLKCDTPKCGYERPVAEISADFIGQPCPHCGHPGPCRLDDCPVIKALGGTA